MRSRTTAALVTGALGAALVLPTASATAAPTELQISEIRIDQPGDDGDEYAELTGTPGASLDGVTYLVIGDGSGGSGTIEAVVDLSGSMLGTNGSFLMAEDSFSLATADLTTSLNFENGDNVTHLVVDGFSGANGDDLDSDDDGTLDATPWSDVLDAVGLVESTSGGEAYYGAALGFTDVGPDGSFVPAHVYRDGDGQWQIGNFGNFDLDTPTPGADGPQPEPVCDTAIEDVTLINQVQGAGSSSPVEGDEVTVRGVVTLADSDLGGFFVEEEPSDRDTDAVTSEGVFVAVNGADDVLEGSTVEVTATVFEFFGLTRLSRSYFGRLPADAVEVCDDDVAQLEPTDLTLPLGADARESLEGMLLRTTQDLQVSGLFAAYANGELGLALDGPLTQPTSLFAPDTPDAAGLAATNDDAFLKVNDRDEAFGRFNPYPWERFDEDLSAGDTMPAGDVVGPLNYSFSEFKIEPLDRNADGSRRFFPETDDTDVRQPAPALADGNDVVAFNVLNYFNDFDGRGARDEDQFADQTAKIVDAITAMDAAVLGLVELENDYGDHYDNDPATVPSVHTLVEALNEATAPGTYDWVVPDEDILTNGGVGPDAIAQGLVYQPAKAEPVGPAATFDIDALLTGDADNNRWPLAQTFKVDKEFVTVVVNHFKSKGSTCTDTAGPGFGIDDDTESELTGNCDLVRQYAASRLVEWVADGATGFPTDDTLLIGDFNSYEEEAPIEILVDAGFTDLVQELGEDAFTYKFDGRFGRLDYAFASPSLRSKVTDAAVWQVNSREPVGFLYYNDPIDLTAYASSDHDPVIVSLVSDGVNGTDGRGKGKANGRR